MAAISKMMPKNPQNGGVISKQSNCNPTDKEDSKYSEDPITVHSINNAML